MNPQKSILVVDDDVQILGVVRETLAALLDFEVDTTPSPEYAFELALRKPYDLLLCDYKMEPLNGALLYELISKVFVHVMPEERHQPPLLVMTGHYDDERGIDDLLRASGVRGLVSKPFTLEVLMNKVTDVLKI